VAPRGAQALMSLDATDMGLAHDAAALDLGRVGDVRPVR
jgi:hypothetical protein